MGTPDLGRGTVTVVDDPGDGQARGQSPLAKRESTASIARCLLLDRHAIEVTEAFHRRGVDSLLLKGPSLSHWLWPGEPRLYGDIDLLVSPRSLEVAEAVLAERGMADRRARTRRLREPEKSRPWSDDAGSVTVDLHHGIVGIGADNGRTWDVLWDRRTTLRLGPGEVLALDLPARLLHVVLHAVQHNRHEKPLLDLERALRVASVDQWRSAAALARELDALEAFSGGLLLLESGRRLLEEVELDPRLSVHLALRVSGLRSGAHGFERVASADGLAGKAGTIRESILPPPALMRHRYALARRGHLGLALSYVWRVVSTVVRAAPSFAEWRRARRAASGDR